MPKRRVQGSDQDALPPAKRTRNFVSDKLSRLSDELLLRILSNVPVATLNICQRVSKRLHAVASDHQLWKAAYYNRFVRPRASRLPGLKDANTPDHLHFSSKLSKWLDEANLVKKGKETNWKRQYKLRHNWSRGSCDVDEIPLSDAPPVPPILVHLHDGTIYTADAIAGLRAWSAQKDRSLLANITLAQDSDRAHPVPTSLTVDTDQQRSPSRQRVAVGFEDGSFSIYQLTESSTIFTLLYNHPASSNGMLSALAFAFPYILTMTGMQLLSLYAFPKEPQDGRTQDILDPPRLLYSLRSHTVWPPLSLSIRHSAQSIVASIAYALPTYFSGWTVGIQEVHITPEGKLVDSRLASADQPGFQSLSSNSSLPSSPGGRSDPGTPVTPVPICSKPTSLSYSHPYLLSSHPDNTLTLYMVTSTTSSLNIGPGTRLWGHTSSVSGAYVGGRGKAVSVSSRGDELRVWELEGGMIPSVTRRRNPAGELSIRIRPEKRTPLRSDSDHPSDDDALHNSNVGFVLEKPLDETTVTKGWIGFDEEKVIVLRERSEGSQALVVYDFT
ncbi:f-box domain containing protein [Diplodia corticola]|uniref:F-box domain containing protein n=1 Tax=Diplodia corticola TaxID=236234 RepID=A0A1J9RG18_9PEZI|nr:f-box domain containing protein [Diplodia corticola]OJD31491.1 f-box domain containing protein [Diplodia corticola]